MIVSMNQTRPISLLPCLGKAYERCFLVYLLRWMENNAILLPEQSDFREPHSTTTRSAPFLQQTASLVIYVGFAKAFDQLWHDGLLYKLFRMDCPYELVIFIIEYLKNRKCYIETQKHMCRIDLFLVCHHEMAQRITSATYSHLFADDFALIIHASPWWHRTEFAPQMERLGQQALNQVQAYAIEWKQPINFPKTEWQWIHRRVVIPTLSLSIGQHPIKRTAVYKYLGYHVDERLSFNAHCKRMLQKAQKNSGVLKYVTRSKTSSTRARNLISQAFIQPYLQMIYALWTLLSICVIDSCLVSFTAGGMQPMTKFDGYQTTRQQNRKHNASFVDSSIKLQRIHLSFSKITFWVKPCLCIYGCSVMNNHSLMLYLAEDVRSISGSGWTLLRTKNENATWIVYRTCWAKNTRIGKKKELERDWKPGLLVDFPVIMVSDQIKPSHTHT